MRGIGIVRAVALLATFAMGLAGCGGGGGGSASPSVVPAAPNANTGGTTKSFTPPKFTIVDLGANTAPVAINSSGTIVGNFNQTASTPSVAFIYKNGTLTRLSPLSGDTQTKVYDLNDSGQAVGGSFTFDGPGGAEHAVLFSNGSTTDLGSVQGNELNVATAINNKSEIVGWSTSSRSGTVVAPQCSAGVIFSPGPPQTASAWSGDPTAINDAGMVVGATCTGPPDRETPFSNPSVTLPSSQCCGAQTFDNTATDVNQQGDVASQANDYNGTPHGWLTVHATTLTEIPGLTNDNNDENAYSFANALNDNDWVVGSATGNNTSGAMLYVNGTTYNLNSLVTGPGCSQWSLGNATDINDSNYIVGTGTLNGQPHGFLLIPQA
jgi:uncharacterized membrane protein